MLLESAQGKQYCNEEIIPHLALSASQACQWGSQAIHGKFYCRFSWQDENLQVCWSTTSGTNSITTTKNKVSQHTDTNATLAATKRQSSTACVPGDVCRAATGVCDEAEYCADDGSCPPDAFLGNTTVCRPSFVGSCDYPEFCTGDSAECPGDFFNSDDLACAATTGTEVIGYIGGATLAICVLPQLVLIWRTGSAEDISYGWTGMMIAGLAFTVAYLVLVDALAGWVTAVCELGLTCILLALKSWIEFGNSCGPFIRTEAGIYFYLAHAEALQITKAFISFWTIISLSLKILVIFRSGFTNP